MPGDSEYFRVTSKHFALTYPQCDVSRAVFTARFRELFRPAESNFAREQHQDGSYHLHVFAGFLKRVDVRSARRFDVSIEGRTYHPNIQAARSKRNWLDYISKGNDHDVVQNGRGRNVRGRGKNRGREFASANGPFDISEFNLGERKKMYLDWQFSEQYRIQSSLKSVTWPIELHTAERKYEMLAPDPKIKKRSWWIIAPPNAGKTRWLNRVFAGVAVYTPRMGKYPFEGYADQDIIIYDDRKSVSFEEFSDVLNTWDMVHPVYGEVRYTQQNWKMGHTRNIIVLSNKTIEQSVPEEDVIRMKKRFIQIVNPKLLLPEEESDDDELMGEDGEPIGVPPVTSTQEAAAQGFDVADFQT